MRKDGSCWSVGVHKKCNEGRDLGIAEQPVEPPVIYSNDDNSYVDEDDNFCTSTEPDIITDPDFFWMPCNIFHSRN